MLMLSLRIKRKERDVTVRENGGVGKVDKGMAIAVVGHHRGVNELTERRQSHGKYYGHPFECGHFICESL